jgi:hypothetical protein
MGQSVGFYSMSRTGGTTGGIEKTDLPIWVIPYAELCPFRMRSSLDAVWEHQVPGERVDLFVVEIFDIICYVSFEG